jgi:hypothetical protein
MRAIALAAVSLALVPAAGAATGPLLVDPGQPVVGKRTLIELRADVRAPLYLRLTSPTGVHMKVRLTRVASGLWRTAFHFTDDGQWTLRVARTHSLARVLVLQSGAALPPFKPNQASGSKASALSGIAAPGVVIGR